MSLPCAVARNLDLAAICHGEVELHDAFGRAEGPGEFGVAAGRMQHAIHAVAEEHAEDIFAGAQAGGDVVGVVGDGLAIVGPTRSEDILGDRSAVEAQLILSEAGGVKHSAANGTSEPEALAEERQGRCVRRGATFCNPGSMPDRRLAPSGPCAPGGGVALLVPDADTPLVGLSCHEVGAGVGIVSVARLWTAPLSHRIGDCAPPEALRTWIW